MKVLIIDDSKTILRINSQICKEFNFEEIFTAENGQEALQYMDKVQLVLCDINMPIMNGFEFLTRTKLIREKNDIKVFMCTTEGGRSEVVKALKLGACNYIVKPIKREVLKEKIEEVFK